ncbi:hypothetical protein HAX54_027578, partial [Datura stramonium]|nr:hypothetical protein [Datura stramonium]
MFKVKSKCAIILVEIFPGITSNMARSVSRKISSVPRCYRAPSLELEVPGDHPQRDMECIVEHCLRATEAGCLRDGSVTLSHHGAPILTNFRLPLLSSESISHFTNL